MLLDLVCRTEYRYHPAVARGLSAVRLRPSDTEGQRVLRTALAVQPGAVAVTYRDGWGTSVDAVRFELAHDSARLEVTARVETGAGAAAALLRPADREVYCHPTLRTAAAGLGALIDDIPHSGTDWPEIEALLAWTVDNLEYRAGETHVNTPLARVIADRRGVCQDFAHLFLAVVRAWGWPARYVSGYQFAATEGSPTVEARAMHAWVEVYRDGAGWVGLDPTVGRRADQRYVVVAKGRDYDDVAPISGVLVGETLQYHQSRLLMQQVQQQ